MNEDKLKLKAVIRYLEEIQSEFTEFKGFELEVNSYSNYILNAISSHKFSKKKHFDFNIIYSKKTTDYSSYFNKLKSKITEKLSNYFNYENIFSVNFSNFIYQIDDLVSKEMYLTTENSINLNEVYEPSNFENCIICFSDEILSPN